MSPVLQFRKHDAVVEPVRTPAPLESGIAPKFEHSPLSHALADEGIDLQQLEFSVVSLARHSRTSVERIESAYRAWTFLQRELHRDQNVGWDEISDEFSRQDEWACIDYAGSTIAVAAIRYLDLRLPHASSDSYFRHWPEGSFEQLKAQAPEVFICSNLAIAESWRGPIGAISLKEVLSLLCIEHFNASTAGRLVATMRNAKSMNKLLYRLGATPLAVDVVHPVYGDHVDLITVAKRAEEERLPPTLNGELARALCRTRLDDVFQGDSYVAFAV